LLKLLRDLLRRAAAGRRRVFAGRCQKRRFFNTRRGFVRGVFGGGARRGGFFSILAAFAHGF
jgi:hypothetical protein